MMRCDVTKFNKRFGICKARGAVCGGGRVWQAGSALPVDPRPAPPSVSWAAGVPHAACLPACPHPPTHCPATRPRPAQMAAKAYVGEDVVCEADLTLVMGK